MTADLSVIVPVYGRPALLARALGSIVEQSKRVLEILVVDDGSATPLGLPDDLLSKLPIRVIRHENNRGAAAARNTGMANARGQWIAFLDSDDIWLPGTLETRLALAEQHAACSDDLLNCYICGFELVWSARNRREVRYPFGTSQLEVFASGCWFAPGTCALILRQTALRIGPFDERLRRLEDLEWFIRFGLAGGKLLSNPIVGARIETQSKPSLAVTSGAAALMHEVYLHPESRHSLPSEAAQRLAAYLHLEQASSAWYEQRYGRAFKELVHSFALVPRRRLPIERLWSQTP